MLINNFYSMTSPFKIGQYVNVMDTIDIPHNILDSVWYHIICNYNSGSEVFNCNQGALYAITK